MTVQAARNKSVFGAIAGDRCVLNDLGRGVQDAWLAMPGKHPEMELDEFVVMPNHFHAILRIVPAPGNRAQHLGWLMGLFKGATGHLYGEMRRAGLVEDIGDHLWQFDYWDDLVTSAEELDNQRRYVRANPANWTRDRWGACTQYAFGDLDLLDAPKIAFVASRNFPAAGLRPRRVYARAETRRPGNEPPAVISTFTSPQEREALRRALAKGSRVVAVLPEGLPEECGLKPAAPTAPPADTNATPASQSALPRSVGAAGFSPLFEACRACRALMVSPQPPGSRLNKKVATWCNEYVLRHAREIWAGDIAPNGALAALLDDLFGKTPSP